MHLTFQFLSPLLSLSLLFAFLCAEYDLLPIMASLFLAILVFIFALALPYLQVRIFGKQGRFVATRTFATENLVGILDAPAPVATVILMGHYDSKSQTLRGSIRAGLLIISWFWSLLVSFRIIVGLIMELFTIPVLDKFWDIEIIEVLFPCIIGGLLLFNRIGNNSFGALDNACSVAILLDIARYFKDHPLQRVNLRFVATGAEEIGLYGANAFVKTHSKELDKNSTFFLVYDSPAMKGPLYILNSYGVPKKILSKETADLISQVAKHNDIPLRKVWMALGSATDHVPILRAGFKVGVIAGPIDRVHTLRDSIEFITQEGLERAASLGKEFIQEIEKKKSLDNPIKGGASEHSCEHLSVLAHQPAH